MSTALLLAEPQPETRGFLERHLTSDGFQVVDDEARPDLVLLGGHGGPGRRAGRGTATCR